MSEPFEVVDLKNSVEVLTADLAALRAKHNDEVAKLRQRVEERNGRISDVEQHRDQLERERDALRALVEEAATLIRTILTG